MTSPTFAASCASGMDLLASFLLQNAGQKRQAGQVLAQHVVQVLADPPLLSAADLEELTLEMLAQRDVVPLGNQVDDLAASIADRLDRQVDDDLAAVGTDRLRFELGHMPLRRLDDGSFQPVAHLGPTVPAGKFPQHRAHVRLLLAVHTGRRPVQLEHAPVLTEQGHQLVSLVEHGVELHISFRQGGSSLLAIGDVDQAQHESLYTTVGSLDGLKAPVPVRHSAARVVGVLERPGQYREGLARFNHAAEDPLVFGIGIQGEVVPADEVVGRSAVGRRVAAVDADEMEVPIHVRQM